MYFFRIYFEVQPVFEVKDNKEINYKYPDTKSNSVVKITKPRQEQDEMLIFKNEQ